jgi:hypothetical protein
LSRTSRLLVLLSLAVWSFVAPSVAPAQIDVPLVQSCPDASAKRVFLPWGDLALYTLVPGGDLEAPHRDWQLDGGAGAAPDNEPWFVTGTHDNRSLDLPDGASATSPPVCLDLTRPTLRFFAKRTGPNALGALHVDVQFEGSDGRLHSWRIGTLLSAETWMPSLQRPVVANLLALESSGGTTARLRFTAEGAAWRVDDVYIDPWARN